MTVENQFSLSDHDEATKTLTEAVTGKIQYLQTLEKAVNEQDDRQVYELIDSKKYADEILKARHGAQDFENEKLVEDIRLQISAFLSKKLINYLNEMYPFFYFEETAPGNFQFYFGNWWGRRLFGTLDVLNVEFHFDKREYEKLSKAFELEFENKRLNSDAIERLSKENERLQNLIDSQDQRDQEKEKLRAQIKEISQEKVMPWESSKQKESKQKLVDQVSHLTELDEQANSAYRTIRDNEETILALSKEDTLIGYEKQSIVSKFGTFENFEAKNKTLYRDYIANLIASKE
ncbi:MAG TPA: exonuclease SbcC [Candidatus Ligilactobacillus excrementigallinarum]|uniref:Exonuclease SbcC n=1 Tax=Candidatus Ligilactobacillus excrementigallinarum TaxID=2838641 RepID=A0A9D2AA50_9LACO|nr:exonuclease SbcC [Candidatus Ligilactobacillus excrementigallinarum]